MRSDIHRAEATSAAHRAKAGPVTEAREADKANRASNLFWYQYVTDAYIATSVGKRAFGTQHGLSVSGVGCMMMSATIGKADPRGSQQEIE